MDYFIDGIHRNHRQEDLVDVWLSHEYHPKPGDTDRIPLQALKVPIDPDPRGDLVAVMRMIKRIPVEDNLFKRAGCPESILFCHRPEGIVFSLH